VTDSAFGEGAAEWTLTQTGPGILGTYSTTFPSASPGGAGSLSGVVTGATATVLLTPTELLVCSPTWALSGTLYTSVAIAGEQLTGRYTSLTCSGGRAGTFVLTRRGSLASGTGDVPSK
jgi:hypothetical protein